MWEVCDRCCVWCVAHDLCCAVVCLCSCGGPSAARKAEQRKTKSVSAKNNCREQLINVVRKTAVTIAFALLIEGEHNICLEIKVGFQKFFGRATKTDSRFWAVICEKSTKGLDHLVVSNYSSGKHSFPRNFELDTYTTPSKKSIKFLFSCWRTKQSKFRDDSKMCRTSSSFRWQLKSFPNILHPKWDA